MDTPQALYWWGIVGFALAVAAIIGLLAFIVLMRKRAQRSLEESEALFRSDLGNIGVAITSADKKWRRTNERLRRMLGYSGAELGEKTWFEITHPEDVSVELACFDRMLAGEIDTYEMDKRFLRKDGNVVFTHLNASCVRDPDGSVQFVTLSLLDITDRKRADEEKERMNTQSLQSQKMEAVGHLAGGIAHDFNNMLSVVLAQTELGMTTLDKGDPLYSRLITIQDAVLRSADLVRQLLAFARKQTISPRVLDINDTIGGMLKMLQRIIGENIDLEWRPEQDTGKVRIDPSQIDQIVANLMVNARDAISGVGKVTIETYSVALDEAYCAAHPGSLPGRFVVLRVSDSGCGMDKETLSKIFEPFFTTKSSFRGTGLGMATVYGIVKQNEGFINVYSEPDKGSAFEIHLPRFMGETIAPPAEIKTQIQRGHGETVLLVEDEEEILKASKAMLEILGYAVFTASTPGEALLQTTTHAGEIQLLLTDVVMPEMNGRDLAKSLMRIKPGLKCLYMSGYTDDVIAHGGVLDESMHFLQKPFSMQDLASKMREALER